jgi:hypothetical protein
VNQNNLLTKYIPVRVIKSGGITRTMDTVKSLSLEVAKRSHVDAIQVTEYQGT